MILSLQGVTFTYQTRDAETKAVEDMTFSVEEGEFVGIVGPSGCGKTTVLNLLAGLEKPSDGEITLRGGPLSDYRGREYPIALMPQHDQLFEWRTIEKNVLLGPEIRRTKGESHVRRGRELLDKYGLKEFAGKHPSELSGGMRQRAALIRTLMTDPDVLLLDEPFSALDFQTRLKVCDDVHAIIKGEKKTAVLVSHDISESISLCDRIVVLSKRPAHVLEVITIDCDKRLSPLKRRESGSFSNYFEKIWRLLEDK
ncbi:MAG: ABC transporter ATP-binding protein [Clostridia bacterium]|nr:ABC transporter ATP-binding protein [Clostridia bacterium]